LKTSATRTLAVAAAVAISLAGPGTAEATGFGEGGAINLEAGGFVFVTPKYEGSDEYEVLGAPIIFPSGSNFSDDGFVQFRGTDDLRFRVLNSSGFEAGPVVGYRFNRDEDDADRLTGLGDVDGGLVLGGYAAYRMGAFKPFVSYNHAVTGDETGGLLRFGAEANAPIWSAITAKFTAGATYADDDYMESFFSISAAQAAASGLAAYNAEAGIKDVFIGVSTDIPLGSVWSLKLNGRYSHLVGDAADSPIVESESQFFGGLGLTYKFSLSP
jgi:MipA family protein